jgi:hypothetical protein
MMRIILLALLIWSFWNISLASTLIIILATIFNIWVYSAQYLGKIEADPKIWSEKETQMLNKYHVYFLYPFASKFNSSFASAVYLFGSILVLWLLWNGLWIKVVIMVINVIASSFISVKLNPRFFLHEAVERKHKTEFYDDMITVDNICEKIIERQKQNFDNISQNKK